jgi:HlyD family secretion protein
VSSETNVAASSRPAMNTGNLSDRVQSLRLPPPQRSGSSAGFAWLLVVLLAALSSYLAIGGVLPFVPRLLTSPGEAVGIQSPTPPTDTSSATTAGTPSKSDRTAPAGKIVHESKGWVIPEQQILVSPQVSGRVIELNFEAGQRVTAGDVLAVLDTSEYKAEYQRALAEVEVARERMIEAREGSRPDEIRQAQAELEESKTQLAQAVRVLKRRQELFDQKILTACELEDAQSQLDALQNRVDRLTAATQLMIEGPRSERKRMSEAELRRSEAELSRAKWRLDNTVIYAPITGTILKKNAELGNLVNPIAFNGSYSLCDIADLSKLEIELSISERDISKVFKHQKCRIRPEAFPERVYEGYVSRLMPIADRAKSAVPVRVRLTVPAEEEGMYLKPEMGASVVFYQEQVDPTMPAEDPRATTVTPVTESSQLP